MGDKRGHIPLRRKALPTFADVKPLPDSTGYGLLNLLISSLLLGGVPGYLLDRWLGTSFIVGIGLVLGMALALTIAWFRYGTGRSPRTEPAGDGQPKRGQQTELTEQGSETTREDHG